MKTYKIRTRKRAAESSESYVIVGQRGTRNVTGRESEDSRDMRQKPVTCG